MLDRIHSPAEITRPGNSNDLLPTIDREILVTSTIRAKLTSQYVRDLPVTGNTYFVWHVDLPSFGVRVSKTGVKAYVVQRRVKGVRHPRRQSIERCDLIGAKEALSRAEDALNMMRQGIDPRDAAKSILTLRVAMEEYLEKDKPKPLSENSKSNIRGLITAYLSKWLDLPLISITGTMVEKRHREIKEDIEARVKAGKIRVRKDKPVYRGQAKPGRVQIDGKATANVTMNWLCIIYNHQLTLQKISEPNPVSVLSGRKYKENKFSRSIPKEHHPAFYNAVLDISK